MWMTSIGWKEMKFKSDVESIFTKKLIWEKQHHSLIMHTVRRKGGRTATRQGDPIPAQQPAVFRWQ